MAIGRLTMDTEIDFYKNILTLTGAIFGIIAFFWKFWDFLYANLFSHLQLNLNVETLSPDLSKITTGIENSGSSARKINYAFLLISPEGSGMKESLEAMLKDKVRPGIKSTPMLLKHLINKERDQTLSSPDHQFRLIPLKHYYHEQIHIGNEKIKYPVSLALSDLQKDKIYTVRFVIISLHLMNAYLRYRSTSDLLINLKE